MLSTATRAPSLHFSHRFFCQVVSLTLLSIPSSTSSLILPPHLSSFPHLLLLASTHGPPCALQFDLTGNILRVQTVHTSACAHLQTNERAHAPHHVADCGEWIDGRWTDGVCGGERVVCRALCVDKVMISPSHLPC